MKNVALKSSVVVDGNDMASSAVGASDRKESSIEQFEKLRKKIPSLGKLELLDLAQIKTSSSADIPEELVAIRDSVFDESKQWNQDSIKEAFGSFGEHEQLRGVVGDSLHGESYLVQYFIGKLSGVGLRSALFDCFNILCQASVLAEEKKQSFFSTFPPPRDELACLGGAATRFSDALFKMQAQEGFDTVVIDSLSVALAQMVEIVKSYNSKEYHIHVLPCLKHLLGFASEELTKKSDSHAIPVLNNIPAAKMMEVFDGFVSVFKDKLLKNLSHDAIKASVSADIAIAKKNAIDKVNKEEVYAEQCEDNPLTTELFANPIKEIDFEAEDGCDERVSNAIQHFIDELNGLGVESDGESFYEFSESDGSYSLRENLADKLMNIRIANYLLTAPKKLKGQILAAAEVGGGAAAPVAAEVGGGAVASSSPAAAIGDCDYSEVGDIYSEQIAQTISALISSDDVSNKAKAVEILYSLCNKAPGVPYIHFVEMLDSSIGEGIKRSLEQIAASKFNPTDQILPDGYIDKISNYGESYLRDGILQRYYEYKERNDQFKLLAESVIAIRDLAILQARLLYSSTEKVAEILDLMRGPDIGSLMEILQLDPNECFDSGIDRSKAFCQLAARPDFASKILPSFDGRIGELKFGDNGDKNCLDLLIDHDILDVEIFDVILRSVNGDGRVKLASEIMSLVAADSYVDILKILLSNGAKVDQEVYSEDVDTMVTPLYIATDNDNIAIVSVLLEAGAVPDRARADTGETPLYIAAYRDYKDVVTALLTASADPNLAKATYGRTPLFIAALHGHKDVVNALLENGADVDKADNNGVTPLSMAAQNGHIDAVKALIEAEADPNLARYDGVTPLYMAASNGHAQTVTALLKAEGVDVNTVDKDGITPLYRAAQNGHIDAVKALIEAEGVDVNTVDKDGTTPLYIAAQEGNLEIVTALIAATGIDVDKAATDDGVTPLWIAAQEGNLEIVTALLENGADVNRVSKYGRTPLFIAAFNGYKDVVTALLENGADVDKADMCGQTPLYIAAANDRIATVEVLIKAKAGFNIVETTNGRTPLFIAAFNGYKDVVTALLEKGVGANEADKYGQTPLIIAATNGHNEIVSTLLEGGVDFDKADKYGRTPLHIAAANGCTEIVNSLLERGANLNRAEINHDKTPLHIAVASGHTEIVNLLLAAGANPNQAIADSDKTPLLIAVTKGDVATVAALTAKGAKVNKVDQSGKNPLYIAVENGNAEVVKSLLENGAMIDPGYWFDIRRSSMEQLATEGSHSDLVAMIKDLKVQQQELFRVIQGLPPKAGDYFFGRGSGDVVSVTDYLETIPKSNIKALVNCQDKYGRNALHQVAEHGYEDIEGIKALIKAGADPAFVNENSSQSFVEKMVAQEKVEILRLLSGISAQDEARPITTQPGPSPADPMQGAHATSRDGSMRR